MFRRLRADRSLRTPHAADEEFDAPVIYDQPGRPRGIVDPDFMGKITFYPDASLEFALALGQSRRDAAGYTHHFTEGDADGNLGMYARKATSEAPFGRTGFVFVPAHILQIFAQEDIRNNPGGIPPDYNDRVAGELNHTALHEQMHDIRRHSQAAHWATARAIGAVLTGVSRVLDRPDLRAVASEYTGSYIGNRVEDPAEAAALRYNAYTALHQSGFRVVTYRCAGYTDL